MEYDPHGTELLDLVNHYVASQKTRIWATCIRKGLDVCETDTDMLVLLTQLDESDSPHVLEQVKELAQSMIRLN